MRILAVAGSSGGHIFPAVTFLDECKAKDPLTQTLLVLPYRAAEKGLVPKGHPVSFISVSPLFLKPDRKGVLALFNFIKGFFQSVVILSRFKPDIVAGFGSIPSIPVVLCAWFFRITTVIHEQNVQPGRATFLLAHVADKIAVSFAQTEEFLYHSRSKIVRTGNAIRAELKKVDRVNALDFFGLKSGNTTILVMGGSQGSASINDGFVAAFKSASWRYRVQVIHLCGHGQQQRLEKEYGGTSGQVKIFPFLEQMRYAYSAADIVICRAGATTVSELMFFKIPAVLIPYPFAQAHQAANAGVLADIGAARVVADSDLHKGELNGVLESVLSSDVLLSMTAAYNSLASNKPASLADEAIRVHTHG